MHKGFRFRLYPTAEQESAFERSAGCARLIYNLGLEQRRIFGRRGRPITYGAQAGELRALKREFPFFRTDIDSQCLQQALMDLDKAFQRFFRGEAGYPRPRKRGVRDAFRYPQWSRIDLTKSTIRLPKIGRVRINRHRRLEGSPRFVTVIRDGNRWFASIVCETTVVPEPATGDVGVDLGVAIGQALSDGRVFTGPVMTRADRRRHARLKREISRKQKGSNNRRQAIRRLRGFEYRWRRRRLDHLHKLTTLLAKSHGRIVIEALKVGNMTASSRGTIDAPGRNVKAKAGLNRVLLEMSPATFRRLLEYKALWSGAEVIAVDPRYTSQTCAVCGHVDAANRRSQAVFHCTRCGRLENADINAAQVILARGLDLAGGLPVSACGGLGIGRPVKQEQDLLEQTARSAA